MSKVIALVRGYIGGVVRYQGDVFEWPHGVKLGRWVKLHGSAFGGKGDHDGDESVGGAAPAVPAVTVPADWQNLKVAERKALAKSISGQNAANAAEADAVISAFVEANATPFADAPAPETVAPKGTGLQEALGGTQPDWVDPATGIPGGTAPVQADD